MATPKKDPHAKIVARRKLRNALKTGALARLPCEVCGEPAQAHHDDYSHPLAVRWLCARHHMAVHRDAIPAKNLPWAELCTFGGKGFGDVPHFEAGDLVLVMFEYGDRRFPVVMGGWIAQSGGTDDLPSEQTGDYERTQRRWVRYDRNGNKVVMDEEAQTIEITSGKASVTINGGDGSIVIRTDGVLEVRAARVSVIEADQVDVQTETLFAEVSGDATLNCEEVVNIRGGTEVNIGEYQQGGVPPPPPTTTPVVNIKAAQTVNVESGQGTNVTVGANATIEVTGDALLDCAQNVTIDGAASVKVLSDGPVEVEAQNVSIKSTGGAVVVESATDLTIDVGNAASVTIQGQAEIKATGPLSIEAQSGLTLDVTGTCDLDVQGTATVKATGLVSLESDSVLELRAPVINVSADNTLNLESQSVARLNGTTVLIAS